jgi:hypothetical protein
MPSRSFVSVGLCIPFKEDTLLPPSILGTCHFASALPATHMKQVAHSSRNSRHAVTSSAVQTTCCIISRLQGIHPSFMDT